MVQFCVRRVLRSASVLRYQWWGVMQVLALGSLTPSLQSLRLAYIRVSLVRSVCTTTEIPSYYILITQYRQSGPLFKWHLARRGDSFRKIAYHERHVGLHRPANFRDVRRFNSYRIIANTTAILPPRPRDQGFRCD